jgi:thiol-disulfide isomerase/thioredoxin
MRWLAASLLLLATSTTSGGAAATSVPSNYAPVAAAPLWPMLESLTGKVVLLDFWASWCSPCLRSFPWMNELQQRHAGDGLVVVAVNLDQERALADDFLRKVPAAFRVEYDARGTIARQFGVQTMPASFLIDRRGQVRFRHAGFRDRQRPERERQIALLLAERAP